MDKEKHLKTPLMTSLIEYANSNVCPFDVPGHRMGATDSHLRRVLGNDILRLDVNAPKGLDNLGNPKGVIKEAQELMADAYKADEAFFLVNGSSVGVLAMIMATLAPNDKILMPRNVHKSAINGLVLSGAIPAFIEPDIDSEIGIANGVSVSAVEKTLKENEDAKAIFLINPTYFGVVSNLKKIIELAHSKGLIVMVDEAHGAHFPFSKKFPASAMSVGADLATVSIHKTSGSLSQTSCLLLQGDKIKKAKIQATLNILQSTSPSYLLLASLDVTRQELVLNGEAIFNNAIKLADYCRREINKIPGLRALGQEYFSLRGFGKFDHTKIIVKVNDLGYSGFAIYNILKNDYNIQPELAETNVVLFIFGFGIEKNSVDRLIKSLQKLSADLYGKKDIFHAILPDFSYPELRIRPRDAYHSKLKYVDLLDSLGEISGESIMIYPPGIPLIIPGEVITHQVIELFKFYESQDSLVLNESTAGFIKVIDELLQD